ncbi:hypothetical protein [Streptomyces sp. NPDC056821]|uniref:hypothetical protein n=1 Tax=unclassified Streptomyces TaxID=2593676 RepID=UPI00367E7D23
MHPQYPPHQPYDPAAVAAAKRRRGRRILLAVLGVVAALFVIGILGTVAYDGDKPAGKASQATKVNVPARTGIPPKPTGQTRTDLLAALRDVHPDLVADEDKAVDHARNQCSAVNNREPKRDWLAQQRFSSSSHEVSDAEATRINEALTEFCATA